MRDPPGPGEKGENGENGEAGGEEDERWLTAGTAAVGAASFFSDAGHEITTSLLPTFLTSVLRASAGALGIITGVSDALVGVAKVVGGPPADDPSRRRRLAAGGYVGTALATGAIGLAAAVWQAGVLRAVAWAARGVRSPARDSLLASLAPPAALGRAFGLERAGDNLGAVAGPLLAALLVSLVGIRPAMWCAAVPGLFAAISITAAARAARRRPSSPVRRSRLDLGSLRRAGLARPMIPVLLFECGNTTATLLILRATQLLHHGGRSLVAATSLAVLVYAAHNACAALVSLAGGRWIDRSGPRLVFGAGAALYVLSYGGFAAGPRSWPLLLVAFALAGSGIGLAEPAESTLVARAVPDTLRGTAFGALGGVQAAGDLVSSVTVGLLYATVSPEAGFAYAGGWMVLSAAASVWMVAGHRLD